MVVLVAMSVIRTSTIAPVVRSKSVSRRYQVLSDRFWNAGSPMTSVTVTPPASAHWKLAFQFVAVLMSTHCASPMKNRFVVDGCSEKLPTFLAAGSVPAKPAQMS